MKMVEEASKLNSDCLSLSNYSNYDWTIYVTISCIEYLFERKWIGT